MKKILATAMILAASMAIFAGCTKESTAPDSGDSNTSKNFDVNKLINVVSREDGSGTRGAFVELFKIETKGADGSRKDMTTKEAVIASKTDVMLTTVAGDDYAIGYVSMGSINDSVKVLEIDGAKASAENVRNGSYKVSRPFNIATKGETTGLTKDFIDFILSAEGQAVVGKSYIEINADAAPFAGTNPGGKIVVAGSSSVTPIMEKLKEAYIAINSAATIEIQQSDSTSGITGLIDGICDIGMASRDLKDSEKEKVAGIEIALDGIAVIVSPTNSASGMTSEQVRQIFTGEAQTWKEIVQ